MRHLVYSAPDPLAKDVKGVSVAALVKDAGALCPDGSSDPASMATMVALRSPAKRTRALAAECAELDTMISSLVTSAAPGLLGRFGVGPLTAATLLVAAGDNSERFKSEAAWAHFCGIAPLEASSGRVVRHRLDRGGNRQANSATWRIVMVRLAWDPATRASMERRTMEGRSRQEVIRMLKRSVAREVHRYLPRG
jgi:transposase